MYLGVFSRYMSDDFCTARTLRHLGFLDAQAFWYMYWTGRATFTAVISATELVGNEIVPWLPAVALALWVPVLFDVFRRCLILVGGPEHFTRPLVLALTVIFAYLRVNPDLPQTLYWQTGLLTYTLWILGATAYIDWILKYLSETPAIRRSPLSASISCVSLLALVMLNETSAALQIGLLGLACLGAVAPRLYLRRRALSVLGAGLIGSVIGLVVMAAAPGNQARRAPLISAAMSMSTAIQLSNEHAVQLIGSLLRQPKTVALVMINFCLVTATMRWSVFDTLDTTRKRIRLTLLSVLIVGACYLSVLICQLPAFLTLHKPAPARAQAIPVFAAIIFAALAGGVSGLALRNLHQVLVWRAWYRATLIVLMLLFGLIFTGASMKVVAENMELEPELAAYARAWDRRDRFLRATGGDGEGSAVVDSIGNPAALDDIGRDPGHWANQCFADYYGLSSVTVR
jgi:hypothetical protein